MSKINPTLHSTISNQENRLAGGHGAIAANESNIALLRRVVLANLLWENNAYVDGVSVAEQIKNLIPLCDPVDVANLAIEARVQQKLRHTPLFIASEMCKYEGTRQYVSTVLPVIITRPDMLTDFLAIYWMDGKKPIANQAKKGLAEAFHNFDEYQFAKYDRDAAIKIRDVMFLVHPNPSSEDEEALYVKIAERKLTTPDTWEVALSRGDDKRATWTRLIENNKIGGLAMLRNLRNMECAGVSPMVIRKGIVSLKSSMLLPLDFLKAAKMSPSYKDDLDIAMMNAYKNLPKLTGKTLFIVDASGSMNCNISRKSQFSRFEVACAMAMLAANQCEEYKLVLTAGDDYEHTHNTTEVLNPDRGFKLMRRLNECEKDLGGGGIFTRQCLEWCNNHFAGEDFDRIIVFSDSQDCDIPSKRTPAPFGKHNYICDVSSEKHGINYKGIWDAEISGWSEHFLTYIAAVEGVENTFTGED